MALDVRSRAEENDSVVGAIVGDLHPVDVDVEVTHCLQIVDPHPSVAEL